MAILHHSTKLCDYLIQATDGKFTIAGCFTNLYCAEFPHARPVGVMVEFAGEVGDPFRISMEGPPGAGGDFVLAEGAIEKPALRHPLEQWTGTITGMLVMRFPIEGVYRIILRNGEKVVHEYPFSVVVFQPDEAPPEAEAVI